MALRPLPSGDFQLIGSIKVADLGHGVALLGPLPKPWELKMVMGETKILHRFVNGATGETATEDPRLDKLPPEWEKMELEDNWPHFRNNVTGQEINCDPRLTPEVLRKSGIKLRNFRLV
jgi:hypothetical protein